MTLLVSPQLANLLTHFFASSEDAPISDDDYNERYRSFLKDYSFFDSPKKEWMPDHPFTGEDVRFSVANTDSIVYETTSFCGMDCFYCGYGELYKENRDRKEQPLSLDTAKRLIDYIHELKHSSFNRRDFRLLTIGFYGGEPLSNFPFIHEIVDYIKSKEWPHNEIGFRVTTNGTLLDRYMDYFVKNNFDMLISLDGNEEHNSYRVFKDGSPTFGVMMQNIMKLKNDYPSYFDRNVNFLAVLHARNSVNAVMDFFKSSFGKIPRFSEVSMIGTEPSKEAIFNTVYRRMSEGQNPGEIEAKVDAPNQLEVLKFLLSHTGYMIRKYSQLLEDSTLVIRTRTGTCRPFKNKVFCTSDGRLLACERIPRDFCLGHADEQGVRIDYREVAEKYNQWFNRIRSLCNSCFDSHFCSKCIFTLDLFAKDPVCPNFKDESTFVRSLQKTVSYLETNPGSYLSQLKDDENIKITKTGKGYANWLFLHPYVVLNIKKDWAVVYNTLNGKILEYRNNRDILSILRKLAADENLYVVGVNNIAAPGVKRLINDFRETFSGDFISGGESINKPLQFKPILHLRSTPDKHAFQAKIKLLDGDEVADYLESINLYINNACSQSCSFCSSAYHQFLCCSASGKKKNELSLISIRRLLTELEKTRTQQINILGGNILAYSEFETLTELLNASRFNIEYFVHYLHFLEGDYLRWMGRLGLGKGNSLRILIPSSIEPPVLAGLEEVFKNSGLTVFFHFIVEKSTDVESLPVGEGTFFENRSVIVPFYNGMNLPFFEENVFVNREALAESNPSLNDTFARSVLNTNDFGKLTVMSDSGIYANVNNPALGQVGEMSLLEVIKKEMVQGRSWGKTRRVIRPCKGCPFNTICPPVSGYEYAIGRYNACTIRKPSKNAKKMKSNGVLK